MYFRLKFLTPHGRFACKRFETETQARLYADHRNLKLWRLDLMDGVGNVVRKIVS